MRIAACVAAIILMTAVVTFTQTPSKDPAKSQACSLLTKEDAAAALGEPVKGPDGTAMPDGVSACEYTGSGTHAVQLNVRPLNSQAAAVYKGLCATKPKDGLTGLGDVTCWYDEKHAELQVLKGLTLFSIELRKSGDATEAIKGLARKVYDRLK